MALLECESFDHYATADLTEKWTATGASGIASAIAISATTGRRRTSSLRWTTGISNGPSGYASKAVTPGSTTCLVGVAVRISANFIGSAGVALLSIRDQASSQVLLRLNSDLTLSIIRGTMHSGTVLDTTATMLTVGVYHFLELVTTIHSSTGTVDLYVDGTSRLSLTGQNTQQTANTAWDVVALGVVNFVANTVGDGVGGTIDWDDVYLADNTGVAPWNAVLGDIRVDPRFPTADGAASQWTPSTGSNHAAMLDENPPNDDTDYNDTSPATNRDTLVVENSVIPGPSAIYGAKVVVHGRRVEPVSGTMSPVVRHSGTDHDGTAQGPPITSYQFISQIYQTNPGTSAQWTEADFNAAEFGYVKAV